MGHNDVGCTSICLFREACITMPLLTLPPGNVLFQIRAISLVCPEPELLR